MANKTYRCKPFVKWAGGKRQILDRINKYVNDSLNAMNRPSLDDCDIQYIEPFIGGGAVFFNLQPARAIINDLNADLINAYTVIRSSKYKELISLLKSFKEKYSNEENNTEFYQEIRQWDREPDWPNNHSDVERAARMIFLNKTCYNGLYRVNSKGEFNTPIGRYKNPLICDEANICEVHNYLSENKGIKILQGSYKDAINKARVDDIIYLDPPYDYEDDDGFTKYQMHGFTFEDFKELKNECDKALSEGAYIIISNNATEKVLSLFENDTKYKVFYEKEEFTSLRNISCKGDARRTGKEVIIWGIPNGTPLPQANDVEKIISLIMCDEDCLKDNNKLMDVLKVDTIRQVSYYKSAASFLNYINNKCKFTERAKQIRQLSMSDYRSEVANDILNNKIFKDLSENCSGEIDKKTISSFLGKQFHGLSNATLQRRASTIKKWFEWAKINAQRF